MKKYGFTLAELLVTIGVIGVLLVLLIRSTIVVQPNQEQIMLKKSYHELSRIVYELINDDDVYPDLNNEASTSQYFANTNQYSYKGENYGGESKFCRLAGTKLYLSSSRECDASHERLNNGGHYTTHDGIVWSFPITTFTQKKKNDEGEETDEDELTTGTIWIDVNGDNGENCFETDANCNKPDRFQFIIHADGKIEVPENNDITRYYISTQKTTLSVDDVRKEIKKQKDAEEERKKQEQGGNG